MAKAVANEVEEATFLEIRATNILRKIDGESEANIDALFHLAKILAPTIIFIGKLTEKITLEFSIQKYLS